MARESKSIFGNTVVGRGPRGEKVMGKVADFDDKGRAILKFRKGPTGGEERVRVSARKTVPVAAEIPSHILKGMRSGAK